MKIGVVSDTHGNIGVWRRVEPFFKDTDLIIHAGDVLYHPPLLRCPDEYDIPAMVEALNKSNVPLVFARGNCDPEVYEELLTWPVQSPYAFVQYETTRIIITHGHLLDREQMLMLAKSYKADIMITGHTHIPVLEQTDNTILMNPGSPSIPKYEVDGKQIGSIGLITDDEIRIVSIEDGSAIYKLKR